MSRHQHVSMVDDYRWHYAVCWPSTINEFLNLTSMTYDVSPFRVVVLSAGASWRIDP